MPEKNVVKKDWRKVKLKIALCYPNIYRAGMSGLTVQLLYALFNAEEDVACERFFLPTHGEPLLSMESSQPLGRFDVVAFTFQFEEDYINALRMMLSSGLIVDKDRRKAKPIVVAGGPCVTENPAPLRDFMDLFVVGEVEPLLKDFLVGLQESVKTRSVENFDGQAGYLTPNATTVKRVFIENLDDAQHPIAQVIPNVNADSPYIPAFGKSFNLEVIRGCPRRCRFCLICHISSPKRERSLRKLRQLIPDGIAHTGVSRVSLIGAGIADYSRLEDLCEYIVELGLEVSVPSLGVDRVTQRLAGCLVKGGQRTVTLAVEAGSKGLRRTVGKHVSNRQVVEAARRSLQSGVKNVKLYFIVGLPGEKDEDLDGIVKLSKEIAELGFGRRGVRLSINPLIPKPHTPFQFHRITPTSYIRTAYKKILKGLAGDPRFEAKTLDPRYAQIQAALSLGSPELGRLLLRVAEHGRGLGGWRRAVKEKNASWEELLHPPSFGEKTVWSMVDVGLSQDMLVKEYLRALEARS